jgi:hypothetical protein
MMRKKECSCNICLIMRKIQCRSQNLINEKINQPHAACVE